MPSRNVLKIDLPTSFYHVYARGHARQPIFKEDEDYWQFLDLFKRHLSLQIKKDKYGKKYNHLLGKLELLCYCLNNNHFHLLLYQVEQGAMQLLMHSVMTSYSRYFNDKYESSGSLFDSRYKASRLSSGANVVGISRYIHLSSGNWQAHLYSSIHAYFGIGREDWLQYDRLLDLVGSMPKYADFLDDNKDYKMSLEVLQHETANTIQ